MRNLKLTLRYDGTEFQGWQTQPGYRTVQETLEHALARVTDVERVWVNASGRTDAGVHALGQVVNTYSATLHSHATLLKAINANLPEDVAVTACADAPQSFDANKDAVKKLYRYQLDESQIPDPFLRRYAWQPRRKLEVEKMHAEGQALIGRHDFRSFETHWPNRLSSVRTIHRLDVTRVNGIIHVEVEADGFLYNMVRAIVGTLYNVGRGYWPVGQTKNILEAQDRKLAGMNAPPQGLFLVQVTYDAKSELCQP